MNTEDFILAVLASHPDRKIKGKKRLQKLAYFLKIAGAKYDAHFDIRDFGPFSRQIARAAGFLVMKGIVEEKEEPIGAARTFVTTYKLPMVSEGTTRGLNERFKKILKELEKFPTVDLEVAATYEFFRQAGSTAEAARRKTLELKPTKATPEVLRNMPKIIACAQAP